MKKRNYKRSDFVCIDCENIIPLPRLLSCKRKKGHIKDLYCPYCNHTSKTLEIRTGDFYVKHNGDVIYV